MGRGLLAMVSIFSSEPFGFGGRLAIIDGRTVHHNLDREPEKYLNVTKGNMFRNTISLLPLLASAAAHFQTKRDMKCQNDVMLRGRVEKES